MKFKENSQWKEKQARKPPPKYQQFQQKWEIVSFWKIYENFLSPRVFLFETENEVTQSCLALCDLMQYSLGGSSIHGIFFFNIP